MLTETLLCFFYLRLNKNMIILKRMIEIILNRRDVIYIGIYNKEPQILILRTIAISIIETNFVILCYSFGFFICKTDYITFHSIKYNIEKNLDFHFLLFCLFLREDFREIYKQTMKCVFFIQI